MQKIMFYLCKIKALRLLLIDNYDSFTYNIVEQLRCLQINEIQIKKNDEIDAHKASHYDKIIISPGPATPRESGNIISIIRSLTSTHSILGICLGHQAIAEALGGKLSQLSNPLHGYQTTIKTNKSHSIFKGIDMPCKVGLYHSWYVDENHLPDCLEITSHSKEGIIMSIKHKLFDIHGVQFHPESYMTKDGLEIIKNFLGAK
jgi:anthranilate synthase component 2